MIALTPLYSKRKTQADAAFLGDSAGYSPIQDRCGGSVTLWLRPV
jgi:hypothetical protein